MDRKTTTTLLLALTCIAISTFVGGQSPAATPTLPPYGAYLPTTFTQPPATSPSQSTSAALPSSPLPSPAATPTVSPSGDDDLPMIAQPPATSPSQSTSAALPSSPLYSPATPTMSPSGDNDLPVITPPATSPHLSPLASPLSSPAPTTSSFLPPTAGSPQLASKPAPEPAVIGPGSPAIYNPTPENSPVISPRAAPSIPPVLIDPPAPTSFSEPPSTNQSPSPALARPRKRRTRKHGSPTPAPTPQLLLGPNSAPPSVAPGPDGNYNLSPGPTTVGDENNGAENLMNLHKLMGGAVLAIGCAVFGSLFLLF